MAKGVQVVFFCLPGDAGEAGGGDTVSTAACRTGRCLGRYTGPVAKEVEGPTLSWTIRTGPA